MKKSILKEVTFCDCCDKEGYVVQCIRCGIEHCWKCRESQGKNYTYSVWCSGSGDGYYCNECDEVLMKTEKSELHSAYVNINNLKKERIKLLKDIDSRCKLAEIELEQIQQKKIK